MAAKKKVDAPAMDFSSMLGASVVAGGDKKAKKDLKPVIELNDDLSKDLIIFTKKKAEMKAAEGEMRLAEAPIIDACLDRMDDDGLAGNFHSSYTVKAKDGTSASFITVDKHNISQDPENIGNLKEKLGGKFEEEIVKKVSVSLKSEVFDSPELQKELTEIMGDKFSKFFQTTMTFALKSGFDERVYKIAKTKAEIKEIRSIAGKNKPFFK
jgi:hypothetical protein